MRLSTLAPAAAILLLTACGSNSSNELVTVNIEENIGAADSRSDRVKAEIILQPEFTDSTMLRHPNVTALRDGKAYVVDVNQLMTFDLSNGRCATSFNRAGQGPEEYTRPRSISVTGKGDWTLFDLARHDIMSFTPGGQLLYQRNNDSIQNFACVDNGWAAIQFGTGDKGNLLFYSPDWQLEAMVEAPVGRRTAKIADGNMTVSEGKTLMSTADAISFVDNDTIYTVDAADRTCQAAVALYTGKYRFPDLRTITTQAQFMEAQATKVKTSSFCTKDYVLVITALERDAQMMIFSRKDGKLVMNVNVNKEARAFPIEVDGKVYDCSPSSYADGNIFYLWTTADAMIEATGDENANPALVKLEIK